MYKSLEEICDVAEKENIEFWEVILRDDISERGISGKQSTDEMLSMYQAMKLADKSYESERKSTSTLAGGDGELLKQYRQTGNILCGDFIGRIMEKAVKMGESNACMKRIVAAPTAGSCGVLPAVLLTMQEEKNLTDEQIMKALFVAGGIGGVIASRAFIAGAAGGCQAEIGAASAMAAGAVCSLMGADNQTICHASAMALKNLLGLACDPVAGLVEVPCIKRNVIGSVNAMTSADLALAGIRSKIPPDEVIDAMRAIGCSMPEGIRETGKGGLAATPTGVSIARKMKEMK